MSIHTKPLIPAKAIHPGVVLKDELIARNIRQKEFAQLIGLQVSQLNEIIKGKRNINVETAILIGAALEMDAELWINLQTQYEQHKWRIADKTSKRLQAIDLWHTIKQYIPLKFFKKQGIISGDPIKDIPLVKKIYQAADVESLIAVISQPQCAHFRKSDKLAENKINILGWQHLAAHYLSLQKVPAFNPKIQAELIAKIKIILAKNTDTISSVATTLHAAGIKFMVLDKPEKCPVDGVSMRSGKNPAIALTLRHQRLDNFAFTLFHELGHVFLHLSQDTDEVFIDLDTKEADKQYSASPPEDAANEFALNAMIDHKAWIDYRKTSEYQKEASILEFARQQNIHPAIVKGRIRYESSNYSLYGKIESIQ